MPSVYSFCCERIFVSLKLWSGWKRATKSLSVTLARSFLVFPNRRQHQAAPAPAAATHANVSTFSLSAVKMRVSFSSCIIYGSPPAELPPSVPSLFFHTRIEILNWTRFLDKICVPPTRAVSIDYSVTVSIGEEWFESCPLAFSYFDLICLTPILVPIPFEPGTTRKEYQL